MNLLLICPKKAPGVESALKNLSSVVNAQLKFTEEIIYHPPFFKNEILRKGYFKLQREFKLLNLKSFYNFGDNIILGGWDFPYNLLTDKLNKAGIQPSVIWCSTLGQMEMTPSEISRFVELLSYLKKGKLKYLLLHRRLFDAYGYIKNVIFLPHTIALSRIIPSNKKIFDGINADLFCAPRYGKNILTQILACKLSNANINLHVNFNLSEIKELLSALELKVFLHPWINEKDYWNFLSGMDISLQITHTESFNYAVAERMCLGIPTFVTYNINLISEDPFLNQYLCVSAPDTPREIANKLNVVLDDKSLRIELGQRSKEKIQTIAQEDNKIASEKIKELFK